MKLKKYLLAGIAMIALFASCDESYLETTPTSALSTPSVFADVDYVKMAVNGLAYNMQMQQGAFSQGCCGENRIITLYNEYPSKEFVYTQYQPGWATFMNGDQFSRNNSTYSAYPWVYYYKLIANANAIIVNVDNCNGSDAEKAFYKAQALTFRAWGYTKLLELYAVRWQDSQNGAADGVILRLDESTDGMPLSSMAECYAQIYTDLNDAIAGFKSSGMDRPAGSVWLTNINVAYGIFAKAALQKQDYSKALEMAKLAQTGYPLMSNADYVAGFANPTSEWLFGSSNDPDDNMWYWTFGTQFACNGYYSAASDYGAGAIDITLTNKIPDNDVRKSLFLTPEKFPGFDFSSSKIMNQTFGNFIDGKLKDAANAYCLGVAANTDSNVDQTYGPYSKGAYYLGGQLKFWVNAQPGHGSLCYMRSSEMVLIEAEANYFLNNASAAQEALVRLNTSTGRQPGYTCTKTGDALFQEIVDYRELELWGEGFNWGDYKRWKKDIVRTGLADGGNHHSSVAVTIKSTEKNNWCWAIPEVETMYNSVLNGSDEPVEE